MHLGINVLTMYYGEEISFIGLHDVFDFHKIDILSFVGRNVFIKNGKISVFYVDKSDFIEGAV
jgi:hypothetical protein